MILQRILHGERLDELFRTDEAQPVLKGDETMTIMYRNKKQRKEREEDGEGEEQD